jgi:hypothetical protein
MVVVVLVLLGWRCLGFARRRGRLHHHDCRNCVKKCACICKWFGESERGAEA